MCIGLATTLYLPENDENSVVTGKSIKTTESIKGFEYLFQDELESTLVFGMVKLSLDLSNQSHMQIYPIFAASLSIKTNIIDADAEIFHNFN